MSDYNSLKNAGLTAPTGNLDLGSATNRYGNIFLQGNLAIGNLVANENTLVSPKISSITYVGDDTAANPNGGQTITINGSGFVAGAAVYVAGSIATFVAVVSPTQITFVSPAKSPGNYTLLVVNTDGGTATFIPGMQYSGVPSWSTSSGSIANVYETESISSTLSATSDSPVTYAITSGALPSGVTLTSATGVIAGTAPAVASGSGTYNFTASAIDGENQDTPRNFSVTVNADVVTWASPADNTTYELGQDNTIDTISLSATSAAGKAITYSANSLPTGLSVSGSSIVGTPTVIANTSSTLTAIASGTGKLATRAVNWVVALANDLYFKYVTLLLTGDGSPDSSQNDTFLDSSTNNFAITRSGNVAQGTFTPFSQTRWSNYFSSSYLTSSHPALNATFTIEAWVYRTSGSANQCIVFLNSGSVSGVVVYIDGSNYLVCTDGVNVQSAFSNLTVPINAWTHIAVVRSGGTTTGYVNGTVAGSNSFTPASVNAVNIAIYTGASPLYFSGYISNVRVVNGTAVYTSAFTPPTSPLTAITNTSLLTCQSNRFIDNSTNAYILTPTGAPSIQAFSPFAPTTEYSAATHGGSAYFDGAGDYLSFVDNNQISYGSGNFTLEVWFYTTSSATRQDFITQWATNNKGIYLGIGLSTANRIQFAYSKSGGDDFYLTDTTNFVRNQWYHVAVSRSGNTLSLFVNGTRVTTTTEIGTLFDSSRSPATIGAYSGNSGEDGASPLTGYISGLRSIKGSFIYDPTLTTLTVPTAPPTNITNTQLLLNYTNSGIIDSSSKNNLETVGNAQVNTGIKKYGTGSINLDVGKHLLFPSSPNLTFGTGDYTVEAWVYFTAIDSTNIQVIFRSGAGGNNFYFSADGNQISVGTGTVFISIQGTTLVTSTWYHVAACRSGTTLRLFRDGVQVGSSVTDSTNLVSTGTAGVGSNEFGGQSFIGYIDDLRITKGIARYTANFTAPTSKFLLK